MREGISQSRRDPFFTSLIVQKTYCTPEVQELPVAPGLRKGRVRRECVVR